MEGNEQDTMKGELKQKGGEEEETLKRGIEDGDISKG